MALEDQLLVEAAFASLDALERRIVAGVYLLGLTQPELGRALGLSARQVSRVRRGALSRMQKVWAS
jgi:RNA polymerase sigma factor (sigma-70 family)